MADESEESEVGVWIPMEAFMEVLNHMMEVCTILQESLNVDMGGPDEFEEPILSLVKKPGPEQGH